MKTERSLKSRALQLLARRDQSRLELRRKLLRSPRQEEAAAEAGHGRRRAEAATAFAADSAADSAADAAGRDEAEVDVLLDWLTENGFLCDARFIESRVHARAPRFGNLRIRSELARHGVAVPADVARALAESELARAAAVCDRRFSAGPEDVTERAAQARFLAGRGFSPEVIHRLLRRPRA